MYKQAGEFHNRFWRQYRFLLDIKIDHVASNLNELDRLYGETCHAIGELDVELEVLRSIIRSGRPAAKVRYIERKLAEGKRVPKKAIHQASEIRHRRADVEGLINDLITLRSRYDQMRRQLRQAAYDLTGQWFGDAKLELSRLERHERKVKVWQLRRTRIEEIHKHGSVTNQWKGVSVLPKKPQGP